MLTKNSDPDLDNKAQKTAKRRALLTLDALDTMCWRRHCEVSKIERCSHRKNLEKGTIELAAKGFTVTEIQCNLGKRLHHLDTGLWEIVCTLCPKHISEQGKLTCPHRKAADKLLHDWLGYEFAVIEMYCQYHPFRKI